MIEAFEIGVSLALQDGVSDAIGKARRDVAALEHAVRESGVSVQALRDAGARVSSVSFGDQHSKVAEEPVKPVVPDAAPRSDKGVEPAPFVALLGTLRTEQPYLRTQDTLVQQAAPVARETEVAPVQPTLAAPWASIAAAEQPVEVVHFFVGAPALGAPESDQDGPGQAAAPLGGLGLVDRSQGDAAATGGSAAPIVVPAGEGKLDRTAPLGVVALPATPGAPLLGQKNEAGDFSPEAPAVSSFDRGSQGARSNLSLLDVLQFSGGSAAFPRDEEPQVAQVGAAPAAGDDGRNDGEQQAPGVTTRVFRAAAPGGAAASGARPESGTQRAEGGGAGPNQGDVFLDGMLVGRWMSKFLNREAERASAGPTGFDARRGRLLPGVTVGG